MADVKGTSGNDSLNALGLGDVFYGYGGNDVINGSSGNDTMYGGADNDTLYGSFGNDSLDGGAGDDSIYGGVGNDIIYGQAGNDIIYGGDGNDTIYAGIGNDSILGNDGDDYIDTNAGDDTIFAGNGKDTIYAGQGNDSIDTGEGDDIVYSQDGHDIVWGRGGNDTIYGQNGNDTIYAIKGNNEIYGGSGADSLVGGQGNDTLDGGAGNDDIKTSNGLNRIIAGDGNDTVTGGKDNDTIYGGNNNDLIYGAGGNDEIDAGTGDDIVYGGDGNDLIYARGGNDTIYGQNGDDTIYAIAGNNQIYAGAGNDSITGGVENDTIDGGDGNDIITTANGNNRILAGAGDDTINAGIGNDTIFAGAGNDGILAGAGDDSIDGGAGSDYINGGRGNDFINGGQGNDNIIGGEGNDTINGGSGENIFSFTEGEGKDIIKKAVGASDKILFDRPYSFTFTKNLNNHGLVIGYGDSDDSITLEDYYLDEDNYSVKTINNCGEEFLINEYIDQPGIDFTVLGTNNSDTITSNLGNDTVYGYAGNDLISSGDGNDIIFGGIGNDTLNGGSGENVFSFTEGDGNDTIKKVDGASDSIVFNNKYNLTYNRDVRNKDLVIGYGSIGDSIILEDYYLDEEHYSVKTIDNSGDVFVLYDYMNDYGFAGLTYKGTNNDDTITTYFGGDTIYGYFGNDSINSGEDDDVIYAGDGDDTIDSGYGKDIVYGGEGNDLIFCSDYSYDTIYGGNGNDTIHSSNDSSDNVIYGGNGNDVIYAGKGTDYIDAGTGNNLIYIDENCSPEIYSGNGVDTLVFTYETKFSGLTVELSGDTVLFTTNHGNEVAICNYSDSHSVKYIKIGDTTKTLKELLPHVETIEGTSGNDPIEGTSVMIKYMPMQVMILFREMQAMIQYMQVLETTDSGGDGDDYIYGGVGNDTINCGLGTNYIYHSAGDGNDTVLNGGDWDVIEFRGEKSIDSLQGTVSGNDYIITRSNGETVTLKDYFAGEHSAHVIGVNGLYYETAEVKNHIVSNANTVNGTDYNDDITATANNAKVYPGDGDDLIHVTDDCNNPYIYCSNDDIISLDCSNPDVDIFFNEDDNGNVLRGLENVTDYTTKVTLNSNNLLIDTTSLMENSFLYVSAIRPEESNDLVLLLDNEIDTFTIRNYFALTPEQQSVLWVQSATQGPFRLKDRAFLTENQIVLSEDMNLYDSDPQKKELINANRWSDDRARIVNLNGEGSAVFQHGQHDQTVNINAPNCFVYMTNYGGDAFDDTHYNKVDILTNGNYLELEGGSFQIVTMEMANLNNNQIYVNGGYHDNTVTTSEGGIGNYINVKTNWEECNNIINSNGTDTIDLVRGIHTINLAGDFDRIINISNIEDNKTNIYGITDIDDSNAITVTQELESEPVKFMFSHYFNEDAQLYDGEDYLGVIYKDEYGGMTNSNINIYGNWDNGTFNLDEYNTLNKISLTVKDTTVNLSDIQTQCIDMSSTKANHNYAIDSGILDIANDVFVQGSSFDDTYSCNVSTINKQYAINDIGGEDTLDLREYELGERFRFFFDVDKEGNILGKDLYVMSMSNGVGNGNSYYQSSLYNFIVRHDSNVSYLKIENFFDGEGGHGAGYIETIKGSGNKVCNIDSCVNAIKEDVVNWLGSAHGGVYYNSVMEAVGNADANTNSLVDYFVTNQGVSDIQWSNYWVNV